MRITGRQLRQIIREEILREGEITGKREGVQPTGYGMGRSSRSDVHAHPEIEEPGDAAQLQALRLDAEDESQEDRDEEDEDNWIP